MTIQPGRSGITRVAVDPRTSTCYGASGRLNIPFRRPRHERRHALPDTDVGLGDWPTGLTFDTTRNRLIVSTLGGGGVLLAYSPDRNEGHRAYGKGRVRQSDFRY